ncbi:MAG: uroporphyrinogen decarboxylase [Planctomycetota bacterium]|jgi:uroporphyrinogen decarboxylase
MEDALNNSRFLKACRGEPTDTTPVWLMRQAGRYMQEYRDVRAGTTFLGLCKTPELAAKVTLDAQRILGVDAAILFADLLPILEPMGLSLDYPEGIGPQIANPVRSSADIDALKEQDPRDSMPFVGEAIKLVREGLPKDIPLIGFAGAPFTLAAYAIEGGGSRNYIHAKSIMLGDPSAWRVLMEKFRKQIAAYLNAQIAWGVQAVQLFDSWVGCLSPEDYRDHVFEHIKWVIDEVKGEVPILYFGTGTATFLDQMFATGPDVIGVDWHTPLRRGWDVGAKAVQGNLDPVSLFAPREVVLEKTQEVLDAAKGHTGHIFNLGHGILPKTPVDNVKALIDYVHENGANS